MNKNYIYTVIVIAIILIAVFGFQIYKDYSATTIQEVATTTPSLEVAENSLEISTSTSSITANATATPSIFILNLKNGTQVESPLIIKGKARGSWYYEGSFPLKMLDGNNVVIGTGHAVALGNWMTEEYVDFQASLEFTKPSTKIGTVVLFKDNPSGLPQNAGEAKINIVFGTPDSVRVATSSSTTTATTSR